MLKKIALTAVMTVSALGAQASQLTATNSTFGAFDNSRATRSLVIGTGGTVRDVNITLDFAKCDDPAATGAGCPSGAEEYAGETFFYLVSPLGTRVDLVWTYSNNAAGAEAGSTKSTGTYDLNQSNGRRVQVTFDSEAATAVGPVLGSGVFRPEELLSLFNGENALGTWTLGLGDSVGGDPLSFFSATLDITTGSAVPEPGSLALALGGLFGLAATRRRKA